MAKKTDTLELTEVEILDEAITENGLSYPALPTGLFIIDNHEVKKAELVQIKNEALKMTVAGVEDREGYEAARIKNGELRTLRTTLEKIRKEKTKPINDFLKDYKAEVDEFGAICQEGEAHLKAQMDVVDKEKERLAAEKEAALKLKIQARVLALMNLNARFLDEAYEFDYAPQYNTSTVQINAFGDEEFAGYLQELTAEYEAYQQQLAKAEADRQAEAKRVQDEAEANKIQAAALGEKRTKLRIKELSLIDPYTTLAPEVVERATDEEWEELIQMLEAAQNIPEANAEPEAPIEVPVTAEQQAAAAVEAIDEEPVAIQGPHALLLEFGDQPYLESPLGKSILRVFPNALAERAAFDLDLMAITHSGAFGESGLSFVVYKK